MLVPIATRGPLWLIRYRFGRDRLSTNVRFASIPTVNSGLWDLSRCANTSHSAGAEQSQAEHYGCTATAEISIFTSRGRRATSIVARAGGALLKKRGVGSNPLRDLS